MIRSVLSSSFCTWGRDGPSFPEHYTGPDGTAYHSENGRGVAQSGAPFLQRREPSSGRHQAGDCIQSCDPLRPSRDLKRDRTGAGRAVGETAAVLLTAGSRALSFLSTLKEPARTLAVHVFFMSHERYIYGEGVWHCHSPDHIHTRHEFRGHAVTGTTCSNLHGYPSIAHFS